jgi:transposase
MQMSQRNKITMEQKEELERAREHNKDKNVERRLKALYMRATGVSCKEVAKATEYHPAYVSKLVSIYSKQGLSAIIENHYPGNRRNMSVAEEASFLETYKRQAEQGQIIEVGAIKSAYEEKVGHPIGGSQIYYVLRRHGWRKVMPRSKHPNKASDEAIEASKKLTQWFEAPLAK